MNGLFHFLEVALIVAGSLVGLTLVLVVLIAYLPGNPLKDVLAAVARRLGTTAALTALAAPIEFIPGVDVIYDVASVLFLIWYWATLFRAIAGISSHRRASAKVAEVTAASSGKHNARLENGTEKRP